MASPKALKSKWLANYQKSLNITRACMDTGISRRAYYNWVDDNAGFKEVAEKIKSRDWSDMVNQIIVTRRIV
jgi:ACT domain-containing protein